MYGIFRFFLLLLNFTLSLTLKRQNSFQNQTKRKATYVFASRFLIFKLQPGVIYFFYVSFVSRTFTIHRTEEDGVGYLFNPSPPASSPPASQTLRH